MTYLFKIDSCVQGSAFLKRDDGSTLTLPTSWLPNRAKEGGELMVNIEVTADDLSIRLELSMPGKLEQALDLEE